MKRAGGGYLREVRVPRMTLTKMKLRCDQLEREGERCRRLSLELIDARDKAIETRDEMKQFLTDSNAEHQKTIRELSGVSLDRWKQQKRADRNAEELGRYVQHLAEAVRLLDYLPLAWVPPDERAGYPMKLEGLRFLSLSADELREIKNSVVDKKGGEAT